MGILNKTRALLVADLGDRIKDSIADESALRELVMELERARSDIVRGLETLDREKGRLRSRGGAASRLAEIDIDVAEGTVELDRVAAGIAEAQDALASLAAGAKRAPQAPEEGPGDAPAG